MTYEFLKSLYKDLIGIMSKIVIKRFDLAEMGETLESAKAFELYLSCANGTRQFFDFAHFDEDILMKHMDAGHVKEALINTNLIPEPDRDAIVADQAQRVLDTYEEKNSYYRTLMGLPPLNDHRWIYVKKVPNIPEDVPVHQLTIEQISRLEIYGTLDRLIAKYPDREYLRFLGVNGINFVKARLAKPFDILRIGPSSNPRVVDSFYEEYYLARKYILATCYNPSEMMKRDLYDPVVGLLMLMLAVRNTMVPDEADYLNYEEILDACLESYDFLRYFKKFPYIYKRRLVKRLDKLLQHKGTDGVLVDVCKLFSDEDLIASRYYLMKTYALDANGVPMCTGDANQDYVLQFVRASIQEHDINTSEEYLNDYWNVVDNDYLWQLSPDELTYIKEQNFNLMMSKYIDVESAFELTSLVFETCCFINLLLYARGNLSTVTIDNVYATGGRCTLFTMILFLLASMAKRLNFDGNIIYDPMSIAEIWRFNYGDITDQVREVVDKYELAIDVDKVLLEGFDMQLDKPVGVQGATDMLRIYVNNRRLFEAILKEMYETNDIKKFIALHNCKDIFFTSAQETASFMKSDGTTAKTYYELLEDLEPRLARKIDSLDNDDDLNALIVYILERLEQMFQSNELKYLWLNTPTIYASIIGKYVRIAINVFKASSVQLRSINMFYRLGDKDPIHVIDEVDVGKGRVIDDVIHVIDTLSKHKTRILDEYVVVGDKVYTNMHTPYQT